MRILIVGGGGREHALAWKLSQSSKCDELICAPGNAGTATLGENLPIRDSDIAGLVHAALALRIDLVVVGPEAPLAAGLVDALDSRGVLAFGPRREAAELESSKWFAKSVMQSAGVAHAAGELFESSAAAHKWVEYLGDHPDYLPVLKADGLAAGKGVIVPADLDEAHEAVDELMGGKFGAAGRRIVIEDRLSGREASAMAIVSGTSVIPLPLSCDYKRVGDGDTGPNTGGMGVYSPPSFLTDRLTDETSVFARVHEPVAQALASMGREFRGLMYAGLMVDDAAVNVLEFNCRFGDPESQAVLPRIEGDLLTALAAAANGEPIADGAITWSDEATVAVAMASGGYPGSYATGVPITGLDAVNDGVEVFHAGTALDDEGRVVTAGGRVLSVVARGRDLAEARAIAYDNVARISFEGGFYRRDIALREVDGSRG